MRSGAIVDGRIVLDVIQAGPDDAACCPGQKVRRTFALDGDALIEADSEDFGRLSVADLGGVEWVLESIAGEPVPEGVEVTLAVTDNRVAGSGGCNLYSGEIEPGEASGQLMFRLPMVATLMACAPPADAIEQRYFAALGDVTQYAFGTGKLRLTAVSDDNVTQLVYTPRPL